MTYAEVFTLNVNEDQDDITKICDIASKVIKEKFLIKIEDPRILGVMFRVTYMAFLEKLKELEKSYSSYRIDVAGRFGIGYTTTDSEDDEKQGNFMVFFEDFGSSKKNNDPDVMASAKERVVQWCIDNITAQPDIINSVANSAMEKMKSLDIMLASSEFVIPIFITIYDTVVNYLKIRRSELGTFEYEINFISCFNIKAMEGDENDIIAIRPNIEAKLELKNDAVASSKFE